MATSTLDPENIPEPDRQFGKGHGSNTLGPSDISDTGSDVEDAGDIDVDRIDAINQGEEDDLSNPAPPSLQRQHAGTQPRAPQRQ